MLVLLVPICGYHQSVFSTYSSPRETFRGHDELYFRLFLFTCPSVPSICETSSANFSVNRKRFFSPPVRVTCFTRTAARTVEKQSELIECTRLLINIRKRRVAPNENNYSRLSNDWLEMSISSKPKSTFKYKYIRFAFLNMLRIVRISTSHRYGYCFIGARYI